MNKEELEKKISNDPVIKDFIRMVKEYNSEKSTNGNHQQPILIGGAVVDILEGRKPKDYDFKGRSNGHIEIFRRNGFVFAYESQTSITLTKGDIVVQFLKRDPLTFDFKISQASFNLHKEELKIDEDSFKSKTLIPLTFDKSQVDRALNSLRRVPHWVRKGYSIHNKTYQTLLSIVVKNNKKGIES